jgi:serine/threonine protein kinase
MPVVSTTEAFLETLSKSGVIDKKRLAAYLEELKADSGLPEKPKQLADRMLRDGLLSRLMAAQLLQGKAKGFLVNNKYKILELLGSGGMGRVYLCEHMLMHRLVALKTLPLDKTHNTSAIERFHREARAVASLNHPNIVRAYDLDRADKLHFLVMEYVDGKSLHGIVTAHGPMDYRRAAHYIAQAAAGLQHAHEAGWVHRDIKPGNLLLDRQGVVRLLDMGLARFFHDKGDMLTRNFDENNVLGTADFLAPEQAMNCHDVDIRADIYSLGATFYYLLTAQPPFPEGNVTQKLMAHQVQQPKPIRDYRPDIPEELLEVVEKMMAKAKEDRYQIPAEVIEALSHWTATPIPPPAEQDMPKLAPIVTNFLRADAASGKSSAPTTRGTRSQSSTVRIQPGPSSSRLNLAPSSRLAAGKKPGRVAVLRARLNRLPAKKRRLVVIGGTIALLMFVGTVAGLGWKLTAGHKDDSGSGFLGGKAGGNAPTRTLIVSRTPQADAMYHAKSFDSVEQALRSAKAGDHIVIKEPVIEEAISVSGPQFANVSIEADPGLGQPVIWRPGPNHPADKPLLEITGTPGFQVKGPFLFYGQDRSTHLIRIGGICPALNIEEAEFKGFVWCGLHLLNCQGEDGRLMTFTRLRFVTERDSQKGLHAIVLEDGKDNNLTPLVHHISVQDCRLEGKFEGALQVRGDVSDVILERNRFYNALEGVRISEDPHRLQLTLVNNTFARVDTALQFEKAPDAATHINMRSTLFHGVKRFASVAGMKYEPTPDQARCKEIWSDDPGLLEKGAPAGDRYFRKTFEVPAGAVRKARLEVFADDKFIAWVNGRQVGEGVMESWRMYGFDVAPYLVPGKNAVAIKATNLPDKVGANGKSYACLLAQLKVEPADKPPITLISDESWKVASKAPNDWIQAGFDDGSWATPRALVNPAPGELARKDLTWDFVVLDQFKEGRPPRFLLEANFYQNADGREGYPYLKPEFAADLGPLPTDSANDHDFLRIPANHRLAKTGVNGFVGAPPAGQ